MHKFFHAGVIIYGMEEYLHKFGLNCILDLQLMLSMNNFEPVIGQIPPLARVPAMTDILAADISIEQV